MNSLKNILFLDIETVSATNDYNSLDERLKKQWARKASFLKREEDITDEDLYNLKAGIYAEFGKIITIGLGFFTSDTEGLTFRTKALYNDDEPLLLQQFTETLNKMKSDRLALCAHNGREFDFPYLSRRMLINNLPLPEVLNLSGKKPWEIQHIDTMDMWKFGDWKHYTSLDLLATIFDIESSKTDMDGSDVNNTYYQSGDLKKIAEYCLRDVIVSAKLYLKLKNIPCEGLNIIDTTAYQ